MTPRSIIFSINLRLQRLYDRIRLHNKSFTIISNNCWGAFVYQKFSLSYQSPTIGLGIPDRDFFKLCLNLSDYLKYDLEFIDPKTSVHYNFRRQLYGKEIDYPVARLHDIEIWFSHYKSKEDACQKWNRRKKRINSQNIIYKWSLRFSNDESLVREFLDLPLKNKLAFVPDTCKIIDPQVIIVPEFSKLTRGGDETPYTFKHFDVLKYLNSLN